MGNKKLAMRNRKKDPRTKKKSRKPVTKTNSFSDDSLATSSSLLTTTTDCLQNNTTSIASSSSSTVESSPRTPTSKYSSVITAAESKIKGSGGTPSTCTTGNVDVENFQLDSCDESDVHPTYVFMDTGILLSVFDELVKCLRCNSNVKTTHLVESKQGLCHSFKITCRNISCRWYKLFYSSKEVERDGRGSNPSDINIRTILACREIGKGHAGINTLCGYMNMPRQ